jgi:hypothetical protein
MSLAVIFLAVHSALVPDLGEPGSDGVRCMEALVPRAHPRVRSALGGLLTGVGVVEPAEVQFDLVAADGDDDARSLGAGGSQVVIQRG